MADPQTSTEVKTIVVPKALEEFFAHRLETRYSQRGDVQVIVDRRQAERRLASGARRQPERRVVDRRVLAGWWSLPDMPFETS